MYHCTIGEQGNGFTACSKPLLIVKALPLVRVFVFEMFVPGIRELQLISVMSSLMTWGLAWWRSLLAAVVFVLLTDVSAVQEDIWTIIITTCWHHSKILNTVSHKVKTSFHKDSKFASRPIWVRVRFRFLAFIQL